MEKSNGIALVVEGGAMRGVFSTGVLDAFLTNKFNPFDLYIGVSAGATNIASFLAEMYQRNLKVYTDYSTGSDFINWRKFISGGNLVDLDWLWRVTIKEMRLDLEKIFNPEKEFYIGVTSIDTGQAVYLKPERSNLEEMLKASSAIPVLYRNHIKIKNISYVDGGLADPIPVLEAYRRKARNILVLRSRPYSYTMKQGPSNYWQKLFLKGSPKLVETFSRRAQNYQEAIDFMRNPPEGIGIVEINPPENFPVKRLTKDISILKQGYCCGYEAGIRIMEQWPHVER
ncbi:MAG: patatin family protein [Firmicutes bacterium]|nr:patatin family protein [Bacillota bacterium]